MKKPSTKPAPFWMSWGSAPSVRSALPADHLDRPGVFETLRVYNGRAAHLDEHVRRFTASARTAGLRVPSRATLAASVVEAVRKSGHRDAIARLSAHAAAMGRPTLSCSVRPFGGCPRAWYTDGVRILTSSVRRDFPRSSAAQVKGSDYANGLAAVLNASAVRLPGRGRPRERSPQTDPLMLSASGEVAETTVANLFILRAGALWTPPAACGILLGVTRQALLAAASELGLPVREMPFTRHELYNADEVFLTNAAVEALPVVEADGRRIAGGSPGPRTVRLREAYLQKIRSGSTPCF